MISRIEVLEFFRFIDFSGFPPFLPSNQKTLCSPWEHRFMKRNDPTCFVSHTCTLLNLWERIDGISVTALNLSARHPWINSSQNTVIHSNIMKNWIPVEYPQIFNEINSCSHQNLISRNITELKSAPSQQQLSDFCFSSSVQFSWPFWIYSMFLRSEIPFLILLCYHRQI